jgi:hypothetical protein
MEEYTLLFRRQGDADVSAFVQLPVLTHERKPRIVGLQYLPQLADFQIDGPALGTGKLLPFIGRKVRTPAGSGTLLQVFAERVTVLEANLDKCASFKPAEVEPVSWELP